VRPLAPTTAPARLTAARWRKFVSYYRPHIGLLLADLGCAVLVSATALALPLAANYVLKRLTLGHGQAALLPQLWIMGAVMLGLIAAQALATMFVDYQGRGWARRWRAPCARSPSSTTRRGRSASTISSGSAS
jgi:ATP-binding cassette subfamily B protein